MNTELESLLVCFAERLNLDPLIEDALGRYRLQIDGWIEVVLFQTGSQVFIEGSLGQLPADERLAGERLIDLLRTQLGALETREEILALTPEASTLILFRRLPAATLTLDTLHNAIEAFANQLDRWTRRVSSDSGPTSPSPSQFYLFP